ncbi:hypothetical protein [Shewanella decolorationis]|uniref:hypothetical protein n=1 Tax=Shewanella decolorationis TaxID=256839 RepID=UPI001056F618|nr:hypothetical protein [Shewanella decolorationis]
MAKILAIALKSFYLDTEVKTTSSKPFEVDEHLFNELKHNGLVARAPEKATGADAKAAAEAKEKEEADAKAAASKKAKA